MKDLDLSQLGRPRTTTYDPGATVPTPRFHWKTRVMLPGAVLIATAALLFLTARDALLSATPVRVAAVLAKAGTDTPSTGSALVQAPGWVEADPFPSAVSALTDGVVEEVLVLEGDRIEKGQVVARLVAADAQLELSKASAECAQREAALVAAQAELDEAQRNWDHPVELSRRLKTAQAQLEEQRAERQRWPSELAREEAQLVYLAAEYERVSPLHANGQASDIELTRARQGFEAQKAEVEATRLRKAILDAKVAAIEAEVQAADEHLSLRIADTRALAEADAAVKESQGALAHAQARQDEASLRLQRMEVRAPAAGVVMTRLVEPGSKLTRNADDPRSAQVVRLYDPQQLQVRVDIPLVEAAKIGVGQPAEVIVEVLPERVFRGTVTRIVHEADVQKNTLQVKVAIEAPSAEVKPEMLARARFLATRDATAQPSETSSAVLFAPRRALVEVNGQSFVWRADQTTGVARRVAVQLGHATLEDWRCIRSGVQLGDRVIVDPPPDLEDGQRIEPLED